ncbi:MAG: RlmE family RNA methyltransferase [Burkholderiaceae bacterium]|jgi:23S rRNA (uridine2552-2'-O)-methyltransferase|nr:RlmE family RNA methyltransferase [Burkholderiaceae bacterium]
MPVAKKKNKSNPQWIRRHVTDPYVKAAAQHGYRSRAAYKLIEIDDKDRLLKPGSVVIDLGAVPGSWTQVVRQRLTGKDGMLKGRIIALDLLPLDPVPEVIFIEGDFRDDEVAARLAAALDGAKADLILSDMAPNLSGIAVADAARSSHLCELAIEFAQNHLKPSGVLLIKAFQGSGYSQLVEMLKKTFATVAVRKPSASRAESAETYLLARSLKQR